MKTFFVALLMCFSAATLFAQTTKTAIYCTLDVSGQVNYGDLAKLLPDSLKSIALANPRKDYDLHNVNHVLLWMSLNGWKLISVESNVTGGGIVSTEINYYLSKEIYLDPATRALFMQNLLNSEKKPAKK
jgi:hypothetical protein